MSKKSDDTAVKSESKTKAVAYIGPTIKGVAVSGTVYIYKDGIPQALNDKIKEIPAIKGLIVDIKNIAASCAAVQKEGTALNTLYKTVAAKLQ